METKQLHSNKPVVQIPYPIPISRIEQLIKNGISTSFEWGIIEQSSTAWSNPMVPVYKKTGEACIYLDVRKLNKQIITDQECL